MKLLCASILVTVLNGYSVICPELICDEEIVESDLKDGACFKMKTEVPTDPILAKECYDHSTSGKGDIQQFCPFDLQSGEYSWINEKIQDQSQTDLVEPFDGSDDQDKSPFKNKKTDAYCKAVSALTQDLLPGRACTRSFQCKSSNCKESVCVGRVKNQNCMDNSDCDAGLYCRMQSNWPYVTSCTEVKNEYEFCKNDFECQNHQFCWYPDEQNKRHNLMTCMSMYSQDHGKKFGWSGQSVNEPSLEDFTQNGKYCSSGLAYPYSEHGARCTSFKEMKFNGQVIEQPFRCDPTNQDQSCNLIFDIYSEDFAFTKQDELAYTRSFVKNQCKCALDGETEEFGANNGYCSSVIGHPIFAAQAYQAYAIMMEASECHTGDRYNMRAQKDEACGIGTSKDQFRFAIDKMFNLTYWPYIQSDQKYICIRKFFSDSYDLLILQNAIRIGASASTLAILSILSM